MIGRLAVIWECWDCREEIIPKWCPLPKAEGTKRVRR
jgi:hypothetical protein